MKQIVHRLTIASLLFTVAGCDSRKDVSHNSAIREKSPTANVALLSTNSTDSTQRGTKNNAASPSASDAPAQSKTPPQKEMTLDLGGGMTMQFVLIPAGSFTMGSDKSSDAKPVHKVTLTKPFYMGKYEVTQEQWDKIMGSNRSFHKGPKNPVANVAWLECQNFLYTLNKNVPDRKFRLPTEAEWEYACRAGSTTDYCYGDGEADLHEYAWYESNSNNMTHPVGEKKPNAWGLYDMHGNVSEWCQDDYDNTYESAPADGSAWIRSFRSAPEDPVYRGGSFSSDASTLRSAGRKWIFTNMAFPNIGLRVVAAGTP